MGNPCGKKPQGQVFIGAITVIQFNDEPYEKKKWVHLNPPLIIITIIHFYRTLLHSQIYVLKTLLAFLHRI